jgi:hypothetical protein
VSVPGIGCPSNPFARLSWAEPPKPSQNVLLQTQNFIDEVQNVRIFQNDTQPFLKDESATRGIHRTRRLPAEKFSDKVKEFLQRLDLPTDIQNFITKVDSFLDENLTVLQPPSAIIYRAHGAGMVVGQLPEGTEIPRPPSIQFQQEKAESSWKSVGELAEKLLKRWKIIS